MKSKLGAIILASVVVALGVAANASGAGTGEGAENITYNYDAQGRLVKVAHSGTVNNNVVSNYTYDKADNRTNVNTTGAP